MKYIGLTIIGSSVSDPYHFDAEPDPDPRIRFGKMDPDPGPVLDTDPYPVLDTDPYPDPT